MEIGTVVAVTCSKQGLYNLAISRSNSFIDISCGCANTCGVSSKNNSDGVIRQMSVTLPKRHLAILLVQSSHVVF